VLAASFSLRGASYSGKSRDNAVQRRRLLDQLAAELDHHDRGRAHSKPVSSGSPNITFTFCTAWLAAPLSRLSMTDTSTAPPPPSARHPMSQKGEWAMCLISGSSAPLSLTMGAVAYAALYASASIVSVVPVFSRT